MLKVFFVLVYYIVNFAFEFYTSLTSKIVIFAKLYYCVQDGKFSGLLQIGSSRVCSSDLSESGMECHSDITTGAAD